MSEGRRRLENAALITAILLAGAFLTSAIYGIVHRPHEEQAVVAPPKPLPATPGTPKGRVEVLNAAGKSGLARAATQQLRDAGFDVVFFGSTRIANDNSVVIDRVGHRDIATAAAAVLHIASIKSQPDTTLLLDATVIIGPDWQKQQAAEQAVETGWKARIKKWMGR